MHMGTAFADRKLFITKDIGGYKLSKCIYFIRNWQDVKMFHSWKQMSNILTRSGFYEERVNHLLQI